MNSAEFLFLMIISKLNISRKDSIISIEEFYLTEFDAFNELFRYQYQLKSSQHHLLGLFRAFLLSVGCSELHQTDTEHVNQTRLRVLSFCGSQAKSFLFLSRQKKNQNYLDVSTTHKERVGRISEDVHDQLLLHVDRKKGDIRREVIKRNVLFAYSGSACRVGSEVSDGRK